VCLSAGALASGSRHLGWDGRCVCACGGVGSGVRRTSERAFRPTQHKMTARCP
jgi:hypothetical protein